MDQNSTKNKSDGDGKTDKMVYVLFVSLLFDLFAFTMILPLLPTIMDHYRKHDPPDGMYNYLLDSIKCFQKFFGAPDRFSTVLFGGLLGSLFSFLQFLVSPIAGGFSDAYGRKPALLISLVGISFSYILWAVSHNFAVFIAARVFGGLSKGNVSLTMAAVTDVSSPTTRAAGMALVGIAFSIGFLVGPIIGAGFAKSASIYVDETWFVRPALFAFALSACNVIFVVFFFKETLKKDKRAKSVAVSLSQAFAYINIVSLFNFSAVSNLSGRGRKDLKKLGLVYFVYLFVYSGLEFTITFLTHIHFGFTPMSQGAMFGCIGIVMALLQGGWVRRIKQNRVKPAAVTGLALIIPSFICVGIASSEVLLYFGIFLFAVSTSMVVPCMTTLASQYGGAEQKGTVMGVFRSLGALARGLGPMVASIAYWSVGPKTTYLVGSVALIWPWLTLKKSFIKDD